jgi:hypothetical protein
MRQFIVAALFVALAAVSASFAAAQVIITPVTKAFSDYVQLTTVNTAAPAAGDCNAADETGRIYIDSTNDVYYFCSGASGWVSLSGGATTLTWPVVVPNGGAIQTGQTAGNTVLFQGYDTSGTPQYRTVARVNAAAGVPTWTFDVAPRVGLAATYDSLILSPVAKGDNQFDGTVTSEDLTAARTWTLPNTTGTVALAPDYAQLYFVDKTDNLAIAATYTLVTTFDTSIASGITVDASKDFVTIAKTGIYLISTQVSFNGENAKAYDCAVHKNDNTELNEVHFSRTMGAAAAIGSASAVGIVSLAATDTIRLKCLAGGTDTMVPRDGQLVVTQIR